MKNNNKIIMFIVGVIVLVLLSGLIIYNMRNGVESTKSSGVDNVDFTVYEEGDLELNNKSVTITKGGVYHVTGSISDGSITVNTDEDVKLVLDNVTITNTSGPAINIISAKNTYIELVGENTLTSTTTEDLDGAIFSKDDLLLTGEGTLKIKSNYDGIVSKDDLEINGGTYIIESEDDGIRGKDSVVINDGNFTITASGDAIKSTNDTDTERGYISIEGGTFNITSVGDGIQAETTLTINNGTFTIKTTGNANDTSAKGLKAGTLIEINGGTFDINATDDGIHSDGNITLNKGEFTISSKDDGIHADGLVEVNGGTYSITASEGIEGTYVKINSGDINISASDDGINAGRKSNDYDVTIEINGGNITINMGQGDTDGIDSNGNLYINGGTLNITGQSPFDYDGEAKYTGGTMIVNGEETTTITNQFMGGGMQGGPGGMTGGRQGGMMRR